MLVQCLFIIDMAINFVSSYMTPRGTLEFDPKVIARTYILRGSFVVDLCGLLPLEFILTRCWHNDAACFEQFDSSYVVLNWQWTHILRWFALWRKHDSFRSITTTSNDGVLDCLKYVFLIIIFIHCSTCHIVWHGAGGLACLFSRVRL